MIIRHADIFKGYTKVDKTVFTNRDLTDGAKVLYGYIAGLWNAQEFTDKYIMRALDISQTVLTRRKKELKEANLILVDQIGPRQYILYVGNTKISPRLVKIKWKKLEHEGAGVDDE